MQNIVVIGSGMGGLGSAYRLHAAGITPTIFDAGGYAGGHTASHQLDGGFTFDRGPHISFTKDQRIQELFADSVDQEYETERVVLNNYWRGYWAPHPVQLHLHGLPADIVTKVITDFAEQSQDPQLPVKTYADWLLASFGRTFAELFPMQYARKYHLTEAENLTTDWLGPRFYRPTLQELVRGAVAPTQSESHYITSFRYPTRGGFASYLRKFLPLGQLHLNHTMVSVDPKAREIRFLDGRVAAYDALVSSVPLPDLIPMIRGVPDDVVAAAGRLACSTCVLVNLGVNRRDLSSAHMTYFYDDDICFTRLSFPHMLSPNNAPPGMGAIQAEVYFSDKYRPFTGNPEDWIEPVIKDLHRCGLLREDDRIVMRHALRLRYANVIFDRDRKEALETVHKYLDDVGINYCGRYGDWGYMWTDESFKSGERAAEKALSMQN
jgi:protoporphyrinogen oxidase